MSIGLIRNVDRSSHALPPTFQASQPLKPLSIRPSCSTGTANCWSFKRPEPTRKVLLLMVKSLHDRIYILDFHNSYGFWYMKSCKISIVNSISAEAGPSTIGVPRMRPCWALPGAWVVPLRRVRDGAPTCMALCPSRATPHWNGTKRPQERGDDHLLLSVGSQQKKGALG